MYLTHLQPKIPNPASFLCIDRSLPAPKHLPYVQLDGNKYLFVSNAAARYLFSSKQQISHAKVDEWLEWEAVVFTPALAHYGSGVKSENVKNAVQTCLKKLDTFLANKSLLADVSVLSIHLVVHKC